MKICGFCGRFNGSIFGLSLYFNCPMSDYRIEKELDSDLYLARVKRRQLAVGFDLFTDGPEDGTEITELLVSDATWRIEELSAGAFSCFVSPTDNTSDGVWFPDGKTLGELAEEFRDASEGELQPLLNALAQIWKLVMRLELSGLALKPFRPHMFIFSEREKSWRVLPTRELKACSASTEEKMGPGQLAFFGWLKKLPVSFPETIQELFRLIDSVNNGSFSYSEQNTSMIRILENSALWTIHAPGEPFSRLRLVRNGNKIELLWKSLGSEKSSRHQNSGGTLRLFSLRDGEQLSKSSLIPTEQLAQLFEHEISLNSKSEIEGSREVEKVTLTFSENRFLRLCGVRVLGGWARVGKVFRAGGPSDVTVFDHYWDEDALVLDLDWPEDVPRVKILASPTAFVTRPEAENRDKTVKFWWHDQFNPLIPKRIAREEFSDWEKIFIRLYSLTDVEGKPVFSLGQNPKSRCEVINPVFQKKRRLTE